MNIDKMHVLFQLLIEWYNKIQYNKDHSSLQQRSQQ
jgi:hypothetical protein